MVPAVHTAAQLGCQHRSGVNCRITPYADLPVVAITPINAGMFTHQDLVVEIRKCDSARILPTVINLKAPARRIMTTVTTGITFPEKAIRE